MKDDPLPPGEYNMRIDRVRKVRNKDQMRIHYTILDGPSKGKKTSSILKP